MYIFNVIIAVFTFILTGTVATVLGVRRYETLVALGFFVTAGALLGANQLTDAAARGEASPWPALMMAAGCAVLAIAPHVVVTSLTKKQPAAIQRPAKLATPQQARQRA